jgi:dGTPase
MARDLDLGVVWVNDHQVFVNEMPHGGVKQSGCGSDMSMYAPEENTVVPAASSSPATAATCRCTRSRRTRSCVTCSSTSSSAAAGEGRAPRRAPPPSVRESTEMTTRTLAHPSGPVAEAFATRVAAQEARALSPLATRSYPAQRVRTEEECGLRTPFQRDRDRIVHSKAFRRLKHKTQVFVAPEGDHYRTRLTHTLEVTQVSRTVARALALNEDLVEAIGLGHDLGHPPFGHIGEAVLDACLRERFGRAFRHHEHSLRVVERLERDGAGLNLTAPVRDGILGHSGRAPLPATLEGRIVRLLDRVAYVNHDIDDALRAGVLDEADLPAEPIAVLGATGAQRIDALVHDVVEQSERAGEIVQGEEAGAAMGALRDFMFERVYLAPAARREHAKIERMLRTLFDHWCEHPEEIPPLHPDADLPTRVTDYLAGMTDRFCIRRFEALAVPDAFAP